MNLFDSGVQLCPRARAAGGGEAGDQPEDGILSPNGTPLPRLSPHLSCCGSKAIPPAPNSTNPKGAKRRCRSDFLLASPGLHARQAGASHSRFGPGSAPSAHCGSFSRAPGGASDPRPMAVRRKEENVCSAVFAPLSPGSLPPDSFLCGTLNCPPLIVLGSEGSETYRFSPPASTVPLPSLPENAILSLQMDGQDGEGGGTRNTLNPNLNHPPSSGFISTQCFPPAGGFADPDTACSKLGRIGDVDGGLSTWMAPVQGADSCLQQAQGALGPEVWHEVSASPFIDPEDGRCV